MIHQSSLERYLSLEGGLEAGFGAKPTVSVCLGAIAVYTCNELVDGGVVARAHVSKQSNFLVDYDDVTNSHQFTSTWSYSTSDEAEFAGKESDAVLVPNINVELCEVMRVSWNQPTERYPLRSCLCMIFALKRTKPLSRF